MITIYVGKVIHAIYTDKLLVYNTTNVKREKRLIRSEFSVISTTNYRIF